MTRQSGFLLLSFIATAALALADPAVPKFYRIDIVVKEFEGSKVSATRTFSMSAATHNNGSLHSSGRVVFAEGGISASYDVSLNVDIRTMEEQDGGGVATSLILELTNPGNPALSATQLATQPGGMRVNEKWAGVVLLQKKPSLVFTSPSPDGRHSVQVEMTAVPAT